MVQLVEFEGQKHEFPDDFSDADIAKALSSAAPPAAPAPQAPAAPAGPVQAPRYGSSGETLPPLPAPSAPTPQPSLIDRIMGGIGAADDIGANAARGMRTGFSNLLGLPVDAVNASPMLLNILPGVSGVGPMSSKPVMGSKFIDSAIGGFGTVPEPPDAGVAGRVARRVGEEVGAAAIPAGAALATAGRVGVQGARELPTLARMFVEPAAISPNKFIRQEATMAGAAGTGAAGAGEAVRGAGGDPSSPTGQVADIIGAIMGAGTAAGLGRVGPPVANTAKALMPGAKYNYADEFVRGNVAETLGSAYGLPDQPGGMNTQPLIDAIERGNRPGAVVPGFKETLGDRTASPGIAALEYSRQSGPNSGQFTTRRMENVEATDKAIQANAPTEATPGALRQALETERDTQLGRATQFADINQQRADRLQQGLTPGTTAPERGATLRNEIELAREAARGETSALYGRTDLANQQADIRPLLDELTAIDQQLGPVRQGLVPQGAIGRVRALAEGAEGPVVVPLSTVDDLRSELLRMQRAALADPRAEYGGRNAAEAMGRHADAVDNFLIGSLPPEQAANLEAARAARRAEADAFGRKGDPVAASVGRYDGGQPRMRDEQLPGMFAGRDQNLEALLTRVDTPETRGAIRDELLARFQQTGGRPEAAQAFIEQYRPQLSRFNGLEQEIATAARARDEAGLTNQIAQDFGKQFGRPGDERGTGSVGKYLRFDDAQAESAMKTILNAPQPVKAMDELLTFVGNDAKAVEAARRQFWNVMEQNARSGGETTKTLSGVQPWLPNAMKAFLDDPKFSGLAERLYRDNPEHLNNLRGIAEALQGTNVRDRAKAPNTSGTAQSVNPLLTPETLQSRLYSYQRGQISGNFLITSIAAVSGRRAVGNARTSAVNRLLDEALLNPEAAALLLKENNPANRTALRRVGKAWLGNEISSLVDAMDGGEDPTKDAVMRKQ
jgi:hypothetical protein